jgi:hypothetical protein
MALDPRSVPITRDDVASWLGEFAGTTKAELREFIKARVDDKQIDMVVDTRAMKALGGFTPVVDMIMDDLISYGFTLPDA